MGNITASECKGKKRKATNKVFDAKKQKMLHQEEVFSCNANVKLFNIFLFCTQVNHKRNVLNLNVVGRGVPEPITSFDELPIDKDLISNLKNCGYTEPTTIQKQGITIMLQVITIF